MESDEMWMLMIAQNVDSVRRQRMLLEIVGE